MGNGASEHREGEEVLELDDDLLLESGQNETGMNLWCGEARLVPEHGGKSGGISRENSLNGTGDNSSVTISPLGVADATKCSVAYAQPTADGERPVITSSYEDCS